MHPIAHAALAERAVRVMLDMLAMYVAAGRATVVLTAVRRATAALPGLAAAAAMVTAAPLAAYLAVSAAQAYGPEPVGLGMFVAEMWLGLAAAVLACKVACEVACEVAYVYRRKRRCNPAFPVLGLMASTGLVYLLATSDPRAPAYRDTGAEAYAVYVAACAAAGAFCDIIINAACLSADTRLPRFPAELASPANALRDLVVLTLMYPCVAAIAYVARVDALAAFVVVVAGAVASAIIVHQLPPSHHIVQI